MPSDDEKIAQHITEALRHRRLISDACARVIASQWHNGQASAGYAFASSGCITTSPSYVWRDLFEGMRLDAADLAAASALRDYLNDRETHSRMGAVPGWGRLWL